MEVKEKMFKAVRTLPGGEEQKTEFTQTAWDLLGDNKEGWQLVTKKPVELEKPHPAELEVVTLNEQIKAQHAEFVDQKGKFDQAQQQITNLEGEIRKRDEQIHDMQAANAKGEKELSVANQKIAEFEKSLNVIGSVTLDPASASVSETTTNSGTGTAPEKAVKTPAKNATASTESKQTAEDIIKGKPVE